MSTAIRLVVKVLNQFLIDIENCNYMCYNMCYKGCIKWQIM